MPDLLPTLFALAKADIPDEAQGENLLNYVGAKGVYPRAMVASDEGGSYAIQMASVTVMFNSPISVRAYDLKKDPGEKKDRSETDPVLLLAGLDPITVFAPHAKTWRKTTCGVPNNLKRRCPLLATQATK